MSLSRLFLFAAFLASAFVPPAAAQDALNAAQQDDVRRIVREFLIENPEVLVEALQSYQTRVEAEEKMRKRAVLEDLRDELENDGASPVIGTPEGNVTVVEFMDYRCGYCKKVFPAVRDLINADGNIRYVVKEFPILGPDSVIASQAALAVWRTTPEKYLAFHTALMESRGGLTEKKVLAMAAEIGLDAKRIGEAMKDPEIGAALQRNRDLAVKLGINGTPAFIVGKHFVPGALSVESLRDLVAAARKG